MTIKIKMPTPLMTYATRGGDFFSDHNGIVHGVQPHTPGHWDLIGAAGGVQIEDKPETDEDVV